MASANSPDSGHFTDYAPRSPVEAFQVQKVHLRQPSLVEGSTIDSDAAQYDHHDIQFRYEDYSHYDQQHTNESPFSQYEQVDNLDRDDIGVQREPAGRANAYTPCSYNQHHETQGRREPLPAKKQSVYMRNIRHKLWPVYKRLFTVVYIANLIAFIWFCSHHGPSTNIKGLSRAAIPISVNLFIVLLFRTDHWINFLYTLVIHVPHSFPLGFRRRLAKIYEFGGVHSGAGVSTALWSFVFVVQITRAAVAGEPFLGVVPVLFTYMLVLLLLAIVIAAHPAIRRAQHDYFEVLHRFCGWACLGLFWILIMLLSHSSSLAQDRSLAKIVFTSPTIYFHLGTTILTLLPWLRLRRVECYAEKLSDLAVRLYMTGPIGPVEGIRISTNPLYEWHSFVSIPCSATVAVPPEVTKAMSVPPRYSILIGKAGDWTAKAIEDPSVHRHYWVRGVPVRGMAMVVRMFKRVIVVTTGSGIGQALSLLAGRDKVACRLVWSAKDPRDTYGESVLEDVHAADSEAVIWDTKDQGRPDMLELTWQAYRDFDAEAVICISNPKLTMEVIYGMESRGIPAFGPIFDS